MEIYTLLIANIWSRSKQDQQTTEQPSQPEPTLPPIDFSLLSAVRNETTDQSRSSRRSIVHGSARLQQA